MKVALVFSKRDKASMNIRDAISAYLINGSLQIGDFIIEPIVIDIDLVYADYLDKSTDADIIIFASRHESASKKPGLMIHSPGNFLLGKLGGVDHRLCIAFPSLIKSMFLALNRVVLDNSRKIEATLEATHHGPCIIKPCVFIEIGSSLAEWEDKELGEIIAQTILDSFFNFKHYKYCCIGIGGPHYCPAFNKFITKIDYAIGHICPKYALADFDKEMLHEMISKNFERIGYALVDWKGLGIYKDKVIRTLKESDLKIIKI